MEYDPDDPPPKEDWESHCWWFLNRSAEWGMRCARFFRLM